MPLPESADLFIKYNYAETKDLCEHFLTVVAGILVFSVTFSEKIVGYPKTSLAAKNCLVVTWLLFIVSIIACGIGLTLIAWAAVDVVYNNVIGYPARANTAYAWIIGAGISFVAGLGMLIISAIISVYAPPINVDAASSFNGAGVRHRYIEGSARPNGASFDMCSLSLMSVLGKFAGERQWKIHHKNVFTPKHLITKMFEDASRSDAKDVDIRNGRDAERALDAIRKLG